MFFSAYQYICSEKPVFVSTFQVFPVPRHFEQQLVLDEEEAR